MKDKKTKKRVAAPKAKQPKGEKRVNVDDLTTQEDVKGGLAWPKLPGEKATPSKW